MGPFGNMKNPWAKGGGNASQPKWAQPGLDYGWGHGNDFFKPKTKEQIELEAMLQLAVIAAVVVAPLVIGAAGAAGAGASAAGMGASAEAAGAVAAQGAGAAAAGGLSAGGASALAGLGATVALQPFLQQDSSKALKTAAAMGGQHLTANSRSAPKIAIARPSPSLSRRTGSAAMGIVIAHRPSKTGRAMVRKIIRMEMTTGNPTMPCTCCNVSRR